MTTAAVGDGRLGEPATLRPICAVAASHAQRAREEAPHARHGPRTKRPPEFSLPAHPPHAAQVLDRQLARRYRGDFQVVHYSLQSNHLHLIVESTDNRAMRSGVSGLVIAFAKRLNELLERLTGKVWGDRYHSRELTTPSEVRRALVYVLQNVRKHGFAEVGAFIDPLTSARRFSGWDVAIDDSHDPDPFPSRKPRTWLLGEGWSSRGGGLLSPYERPA